jgi:hypothetical protein
MVAVPGDNLIKLEASVTDGTDKGRTFKHVITYSVTVNLLQAQFSFCFVQVC